MCFLLTRFWIPLRGKHELDLALGGAVILKTIPSADGVDVVWGGVVKALDTLDKSSPQQGRGKQNRAKTQQKNRSQIRPSFAYKRKNEFEWISV